MINTNEFDVYELEWKWFNSDNDSKVTENSSYKINIIVDILLCQLFLYPCLNC